MGGLVSLAVMIGAIFFCSKKWRIVLDWSRAPNPRLYHPKKFESLFRVIFMYGYVDIHIDVYIHVLLRVMINRSVCVCVCVCVCVFTHTNTHIYKLLRVLV